MFDLQKTIWIIVVILALVVIYYQFIKPVHNEGTVELEQNVSNEAVNNLMDQKVIDENLPPIESEPVSQATLDKLHWKNEASGKEEKVNFAEGERGGDHTDDWDKYFGSTKIGVEEDYVGNNNKFKPLDETSGNLASYAGKAKAKQTPEDLFNADKLLPQEVNKDWFEIMPEPIKVKNRHLINVTKPIGVDTIATSLKNATHDLRGDVPNPKFVVSPWMQSPIESSDYNIKGLCNY